MTDNSLVYYLSCGWEYFKRGHFSSPKNECPWCNFKHGPWQWGWGGVEGGDGVGRRGCLSWHFSRGLWKGVGAASAPVDVSLEGMFLLISLQNSQHTDFSLAVGKSRVLSYKKMPHQGKPCVWPRKLPCRPGGWGVVGRSAGRLPCSQGSTRPGKGGELHWRPIGFLPGQVVPPHLDSRHLLFTQGEWLCQLLSGFIFWRRLGLFSEFAGRA